MSIPFPGIDWLGLSPGAVLAVLFGLRTADLTLATLRVLAIIRGRPTVAWLLGFFGATLFILGAAGLLANITQPLSIVAYAAGFATGTAMGLTLERQFLPANSLVRIYSPSRGRAIASALREVGRGATEVPARGRGGTVDVIFTYIRRRQENRVRREIRKLDPEVVMTVENVRVLAGGWRP
ncbi:MAG: DUF2179 domain-containing protein [Anaerolineae bacterium]|nr:MAG: DUF2179 domain-containing protein [Anaerolineae bacterium]